MTQNEDNTTFFLLSHFLTQYMHNRYLLTYLKEFFAYIIMIFTCHCKTRTKWNTNKQCTVNTRMGCKNSKTAHLDWLSVIGKRSNAPNVNTKEGKNCSNNLISQLGISESLTLKTFYFSAEKKNDVQLVCRSVCQSCCRQWRWRCCRVQRQTPPDIRAV